jgi:hypothetical protein
MQGVDLLLLRQLSGNSGPYRDPLAAVDWPRLAEGGFWLPEPALSLWGLPEYGAFSPQIRRRLSQYEFVNALHAGLWLESVFVARLSRRLAPSLPRAEYEYFLHELREEAGHSLMFLKAIESGGLALPEGAWRAPRFADWMARRAPASGALFWLATVIAEDIPDKFNRHVRASSGVNPAVRQICTLHALDEARHIAAARSRLEAALARASALRRAWLAPFAGALLRQFVAVFYLPPAAFYELAGLTHGEWWRRQAARNPARRAFVEQRLAPTLRLLERYGLRPRLWR